MAKPAPQLSLFPELPEVRKSRAKARSRLFFALWPSDQLRQQLAAAAALIPPGDATRAYRVRPERYHLTMAFLGAIDAAQTEAALRAGDAVRARDFRLRLDTVGYFAQPRVAWIGPETFPIEMTHLKAELDRELLHFGLPIEPGAFRPHITCLRGLSQAPDAPPIWIDWPVQEFVLVKSVLKPGASSYKVLRRWPLASAQSSFSL